tara:strand:+ start:172 stop:615 length:444 start_codon:yes stop_codon:yes gene_type:complete
MKSYFILTILIFNFLFSQEPDSISYSNNDTGYVQINTDSIGLNLYIDDILVGQSPLNDPIPVKTGFHNVTYIEPNYITALKEHFSEDEINFLLKESTKKIYVSKNKTVFVNLWWKTYEDKIKNRKKMKWIRTGLSSIIISILIILNS